MRIANLVRAVVVTAIVAGLHNVALAQDCPGPQRMVIGFAPGGGGDALTRLMAERLSARTGRVVIVENRVGAGGNIGSTYVAKAAPDGCTLLVTGNHHNLNPLIFNSAGYEPRDFAPVIHLTSAPSVVVANPDSGYTTLQALVTQARSNPGKISYGTSGIGGPNHIAMERFVKAAGLQMVHVPYRGAAPALAETVGGVVPLSIGSASAVQPFIAAGRLRALAVTTAKRWPSLPNIPSLAEAGYPNAVTVTWNAVLVPAGTPLAMREKLNAELKAVLEEPVVRQKLAAMGFEPVGTGIAELASFLQDDERVSGELARTLNLKVD